MAEKKVEPVANKVTESKFSKEQIVDSKRYANDVDIVKALLDDRTMYTLKNVDNILEKFKKGKVK